MIFQRIKIISGGQTGVDRAALDFALKQGIHCGGWCPKGRRADDGPISTSYPLLETGSAEYPERTKMNILHSDGTLIISSSNFYDRGTVLTRKLCKQYGKPCLEIDLDKSHESLTGSLQTWLRDSAIQILNIAGPREGSLPGIYKKTLRFLGEMSK